MGDNSYKIIHTVSQKKKKKFLNSLTTFIIRIMSKYIITYAKIQATVKYAHCTD